MGMPDKLSKADRAALAELREWLHKRSLDRIEVIDAAGQLLSRWRMTDMARDAERWLAALDHLMAQQDKQLEQPTRSP